MIPDRVAVAHTAAPAGAAAGVQQGLEQGGLARKIRADQRRTTRSFSRIRHGRLHHTEKLPPKAESARPAAPLSARSCAPAGRMVNQNLERPILPTASTFCTS